MLIGSQSGAQLAQARYADDLANAEERRRRMQLISSIIGAVPVIGGLGGIVGALGSKSSPNPPPTRAPTTAPPTTPQGRGRLFPLQAFGPDPNLAPPQGAGGGQSLSSILAILGLL